MLGFTTKEGLEFEGMTEALTTMFKDPDDYVLEAPRARTVLKLPERPQEVHSQVSSSSSFTTGDTVSVHNPAAILYRQIEKVSTPTYNAFGLVKLNQSCVELPTSSSERRKWGDVCVEEEAESDEEGYAQITMDFREPRSPVGSIDSDTPIVRLDANILHPRALRMLGFTTKEGLEFEGMTEALTTMFKDPDDYVLEAPRARTVLKLPERPQEVHSQVSSSSSFTTGDTVSVHNPAAILYRQIEKVSTPTYNAFGTREVINIIHKQHKNTTKTGEWKFGHSESSRSLVNRGRHMQDPCIEYTAGCGISFSSASCNVHNTWEMQQKTWIHSTKEGLVKLNQSCVELPTSSSERRKWGDDCVEEEAESDEEGYAQITMDFREPRSPVGSIDSETPIVRLDANILHPRALRMLGFTTKEGLEFEGMTEALTTMFKDPADYVLEAPRARTVLKLPERPQEVQSQVSSSSSFITGLVKLNQSCVELPTSSSERRKWGDDCFEKEAESDEDGCAQITMDFREPRSPVGSIDSDTPIVRLDANILHPRALRMLGFTTKEGLEFEGMTEALTTMFRDPADYVLETPRARSVIKQPDRTQEVHSQVYSSSSFTTSDTVSIQTPSAFATADRYLRETVKVSTPTYNAAGRAPEPIRSARAERAFRRKAILRSLKE
ncbi:hypothetical protein K7X08_007701 [Anisodus acutangulus]|uniref:Uncharacterized protein n=1 Tax=Anisodus acutangulus TaxID=402998 RepID=A0A9Q1QTW5_9SOLA|nr:hypothetical protein K7X08_007701 [Anisodus acutangulus]